MQQALSPSHTASLIYTLAFVVVYGGALAWSLGRVRKGDLLAVWLIVAGTVAVLLEPLLDHLSLFTYSADNVAVVFWSFGVPIPLLAVIGYGFYFGAEAYLGYRFIADGAAARHLWRLYAFAWLADLVLETIAIKSDLFGYFGDQPFNPWGFPLAFAFINAIFPILCGGVVFALRHVLVGARAALCVPLATVVFAGMYVGAGWPMFVTLNSDVPSAVRWLGAVATMGLALALTWSTIRAIDWLRAVQGTGAPGPEPVRDAVLA